MVESKVWYVNTNQQTYGPYDKDEVISMLKDGSVKFSDYIFREGFNGWEYIYNVNDFDRRILMPGGNQPVVEAPKAATIEKIQKVESKEGKDLWYVHDGESQLGPYSSDYIKEALDKKTLFWTYYVWKDGFDAWVQIKNCKDFDRRTKPRGESPAGLDITTNYDEIQQQAVRTLPKAEGQLYSDVAQPSNFQYGVSEIEQAELKGKYPIKAIVFLITLMALLLGIVQAYPWFIKRAKENKATEMYDKGVELVEQKKYEEGFNMLSDLYDMYTATRAARKEQNYVRSKEPVVKGQLADEARKIKKSIESYVKKYGVLPTNAADINYIPSFWMKYFGETYYKKDNFGRISVMVRGHKIPVESYVFTSEGLSNETESELTQLEFDNRAQNYIKLTYTGSRVLVKPLELPTIVTKKEAAPQPQPQAQPQPQPAQEPEPVKETKKEPIAPAAPRTIRRDTGKDVSKDTIRDENNPEEEPIVDENDQTQSTEKTAIKKRVVKPAEPKDETTGSDLSL